jgi:NAD(P)-dependent dehydrogenase (short-subunit alcohol dehydrogenase family)
MDERRRVILVTGAGSGIGAAVCRALAGPGAAVLVHTRRNAAGAEATAEAARAAGGLAEVALGDLAQAATAEGLVARAVAAFGGLDVVVSNAGFADRTPAAALDDAGFAASMDAIALAFLRLARAARPQLARSGQGRLIGVGSFVAHMFRAGAPVFPASAAAKAALEALVRAMAVEFAGDGITVNAVVPGFIAKEEGARAALDPKQFAAQVARIPLGRLGKPADVAGAVAYLASPGAGYVTGQALHVNGGLVIGA